MQGMQKLSVPPAACFISHQPCPTPLYCTRLSRNLPCVCTTLTRLSPSSYLPMPPSHLFTLTMKTAKGLAGTPKMTSSKNKKSAALCCQALPAPAPTFTSLPVTPTAFPVTFKTTWTALMASTHLPPPPVTSWTAPPCCAPPPLHSRCLPPVPCHLLRPLQRSAHRVNCPPPSTCPRVPCWMSHRTTHCAA